MLEYHLYFFQAETSGLREAEEDMDECRTIESGENEVSLVALVREASEAYPLRDRDVQWNSAQEALPRPVRY